ncbi:efflux RND transporter periplasmic adaptor subunit [Paraburkholderia caledonica]|uniref:efflux RND transporter periplasmic adaptor subunit n=1 Tax=Paraburkholderia caledonica TaxID=134536 RepID=UPI0038B93DF4
MRPLVSGAVVSVHFHDGATVKKGRIAFHDRPASVPSGSRPCNGATRVGGVPERLFGDGLGRALRLLSDNAIAKRDYDQALNANHEAIAAVKAAKAALEAAQINLGYTAVAAPVSGRLSRAGLTVGNIVSAGVNAPLLTTLGSTSPIYASFEVDEQTYLRFLSQDSKVTVPVSVGLAKETGYSRQGVIDSVDNRLNTSSGTIRARARFDNTDGVLVPGLCVRARVGGGAPHHAVLVNDAAAQTDQDKKFVLLVDKENKVQYREVKLGEQSQSLRAIAGGLRALLTVMPCRGTGSSAR